MSSVPSNTKEEILSLNIAAIPFEESAQRLQEYINSRKRAKDLYESYSQNKSCFVRNKVTVFIFFVIIIPLTLALGFSSYVPLIVFGISFFVVYIAVLKRITDDTERDFCRDCPNEAIKIFPK